MIQPTHMCYSDAGTEADDSSGLNSVQLGQDPARVRGQRGQDLTVTKTQTNTHFDLVTFAPVNKTNRLNKVFILLGQSDEPHVVFWVTSRL